MRKGACVRKRRRILRNKSDLVKALHDRQGALSRKEIGEVVDGILDLIVDTVAQGGEVGLVGFGKFRPVVPDPRPVRTPKSGDPVAGGGRAFPRFVPGKSFRQAVETSPAFSAPDRP